MSAKSMSSPQPCRAAHRWCHSADCCVHSGRFRRKNLHHAKKTTLLGGLLRGGDNWNYYPHFTAFHAFSTPLKKPHNHALFRAFRVCTRNRKNTNFQKIRVRFVYGSMGRDTPAHRFFNTTPICSRRTRCTARGVPSSACPERRRRSPSSSFAPWKARPCCPLCPCPM